MNFDEEIEKVEAACKKYHFRCHATVNGVFIRTKSIAGWYISLGEDKPKLFHENYRHTHKYGHGALESYHEHTGMRETTPEGYVEYICAHDKAMLSTKKGKEK